jgi:hypothetical protein
VPGPKAASENVEFYATVREALFAGYRPCKRCTPLEPAGKQPKWVARLIERVEASPMRAYERRPASRRDRPWPSSALVQVQLRHDVQRILPRSPVVRSAGDDQGGTKRG